MLTQIDPDIFTLRHCFSAEECETLIATAEAIGFREATVGFSSGAKLAKAIRNNDRVTLQDPELANTMFQKVANSIPSLEGMVPVAVDAKIRFYRYTAGQMFRRHRDGHVTNEQGQTSLLTYLVYLNDSFAGGETIFSEVFGSGANRKKVIHDIQPETGMALLFRHHRLHEGCPILQGTKYVLRSDIFFDSPDKRDEN